MLILTRRVGETLMVGDEVTVTVLGVKGNQVRIGVNAPKEVAVHRGKFTSAFSARRTVVTLTVTTNALIFLNFSFENSLNVV